MTIARDLYALLDSLGPQFPAGIPKQLIDSAGRQARLRASSSAGGSASEVRPLPFVRFGTLGSGIVFAGSWACSGAEDVFSGEEGTLLKGAIEKGLRLTCEEVLVLRFENLPPEGLAEILERGLLSANASLKSQASPRLSQVPSKEPTVLVILGGNESRVISTPAREKLQSENLEVAIIATHTLRAVLHDDQTKRAFWNDLKSASARRRAS
jgi:hypothetical protein